MANRASIDRNPQGQSQDDAFDIVKTEQDCELSSSPKLKERPKLQQEDNKPELPSEIKVPTDDLLWFDAKQSDTAISQQMAK